MKKKSILSLFFLAGLSPLCLGQNNIPDSGNVSIGRPNSTFGEIVYGGADPVLHVYNPGSVGSFRPIARFQSGGDGDYTGAAIVINHENDRGLILEAGRGDSNQAVAYFGLVNNVGGVARFMSAMQGGRVGLGTDDPDVYSNLTIDSKSSLRHPLMLVNQHASQASIAANHPNAAELGNAYAFTYQDQSGSGTWAIESRNISDSGNSADFAIVTRGTSWEPGFILQNGGNVGIGTGTPNHKLDVKGTVRAEEVIVETGWSDFVFDEGYELKSLDEVERHIETHGHLPDVPSAAEIESEGLSVGEAQKVMMQKIEELTLYMIEKDKEVACLKDQLALQQEKIERLESGR